jgi:tRNA(Ile)-lysidine synthetase-like protein
LRIRPGGPNRTLKNLYQEHGIPAALRPWFPMVEDGAGLLLMAAPFGMHHSHELACFAKAAGRDGPAQAGRDAGQVTLRWHPGSPHDPRHLFAAVQNV